MRLSRHNCIWYFYFLHIPLTYLHALLHTLLHALQLAECKFSMQIGVCSRLWMCSATFYATNHYVSCCYGLCTNHRCLSLCNVINRNRHLRSQNCSYGGIWFLCPISLLRRLMIHHLFWIFSSRNNIGPYQEIELLSDIVFCICVFYQWTSVQEALKLFYNNLFTHRRSLNVLVIIDLSTLVSIWCFNISWTEIPFKFIWNFLCFFKLVLFVSNVFHDSYVFGWLRFWNLFNWIFMVRIIFHVFITKFVKAVYKLFVALFEIVS